MQEPPAIATFDFVIDRIRQRLRHVSPRSWRNLLALLAPFALGLSVVLLYDAGDEITAERIQREVLALGGIGLVAFLAAAAVRPLFVVISGSLFAVAAGMVWGPYWGTALALFGALLSTAIVFGLARVFGSGAVRDLAGDKFDKLAGAAQVRGFAFVFVATLGFVFPTDLVIAVAASTGVRSRTVLAATAAGTFPGTVAMVVLGANVAEPSAAPWWIGGGAVVGLTVLALVLAKIWFPRLSAPRPSEARGYSRA
ncbi:TVP38/TMEM64 family protein [Vulgatibacter sp.]|uniref:TVP38/TMEM64 family protein n=1 Tax=Vulgatibacter sp. TaxID=1971226 RepID=UPI00356475F4